MVAWFLGNIALSVLALVFITLNDSAPHRLRFFAGFSALVAWLVPLPLLPALLPANMVSLELLRVEQTVAVTSTQLSDVIPVIVTMGDAVVVPRFITLTVLEMGFLALTLIGCAWFAWKVVAHQLLLCRLERSSDEGNCLWVRARLVPACPIGVQHQIAGAFASGLLRPRIWVHRDLVHSPQLKTLLRHEVTHIRQHDNWYLLVITLVERLFWWNPLVWYLGRSTRELQELSCDELCGRSDSDYPLHLAQLMLDSARGGQQPTMLALGANIFNNPNPNLKRIQLLQRSYPMLKKHIFGAAFTAAVALLAVGFVTAQPAEAQVAAMPAIEPAQLMRGRGDPGRPQVMRQVINGEDRLSFRFPQVRLSQVLMVLTPYVSPGSRPEMRGVATVRTVGAGAVSRLSTPQLIESIGAAGGPASWEQDRSVVSFSPEFVVSDKLVLAYPADGNRRLSAMFTNLTIAEAIDAIAQASACNIFQDGDTIVVDYCRD